MPKIEYPMFLFDAKGKSVLVTSVDQHQQYANEGWAESPEEAKGETRAHEPHATWPGDLPPALRTAPPRQEYPKWVFSVDGKQSREVKTAEQHAALGDGWFETPDASQRQAPPPSTPPPVNGVISTETPELPSMPPAAPTPSTPLNPAAMKADEAIAYLDTVTDFEQLAAAFASEEAGGNRVTVKRAIEARINELAAAAAKAAEKAND